MAAQQYVSEADFLAQSIPGDAFTGLGGTIIDQALLWASGIADSYLRKRYALPLSAWGQDLEAYVCDLAQFRLLSRRGFRPGSGNSEISVKRYDDAIAWFKDVSRGLVEVDCTDATPTVDEDGSLSGSSAPAMNWGMTTQQRCCQNCGSLTCFGGCDEC